MNYDTVVVKKGVDYNMSRQHNGVIISKTPSRVKGEVEELKGNKYGRLTAIEFHSKDKYGRARWECLCSCGTTKIVEAQHLKSGKIVSCSCLNREKASKRMKVLAKTHGASYEPWFSNYSSMVTRTTKEESESYKYYDNIITEGEKIERSWLEDPYEFHKHIGDKPSKNHSIDRIDNSKGYVIGNVRWATPGEQSMNRSHFTNDTITGIVGVVLEPKGSNRRAVDRYFAHITVNKKVINLGRYLRKETAKVVRHRAEHIYGFNVLQDITEKEIQIHKQEMYNIAYPDKPKIRLIHQETGECKYYNTWTQVAKDFGIHRPPRDYHRNTGEAIKQGTYAGWKVYTDE